MTSDQIWESDRAHLTEVMGVEITRRKIRKVAFSRDGKLAVAEVGQSSPYNGGTVRAIYEDGRRGCFMICAGVIEIAPKDSIVEDMR